MLITLLCRLRQQKCICWQRNFRLKLITRALPKNSIEGVMMFHVVKRNWILKTVQKSFLYHTGAFHWVAHVCCQSWLTACTCCQLGLTSDITFYTGSGILKIQCNVNTAFPFCMCTREDTQITRWKESYRSSYMICIWGLNLEKFTKLRRGYLK